MLPIVASEPVLVTAPLKCLTPALQDVLHGAVSPMEGLIIDRTSRNNRRVDPVPVDPSVKDNYLLSIHKDRNVRVVRRNDELTLFFRRAQSLDDVVVDEPVVEIVFRLVEYQRSIALQQREQENRSALLPCGQAA